MNKDFDVIVCDLDGTLLPKSQIISEETIAFLHQLQKNGKHVIIATGRNATSLRNIVNTVCLKEHRSFLITCNGQSILNFSNNEFIEGERLSIKDSLDLIAMAKQNKLIIYVDNDESYYQSIASIGFKHGLFFLIRTLKRARWIFKQVHSHTVITTKHIEKAVVRDLRKICFAGSLPYLLKLKQAIESKYADKFDILLVSENWMEVIRKGNSKGHALNTVSQILDIPLEKFIAFGDGENDLSMLQNAGCGVAMGNAMESVKAAADDVTITNDEHGVLHYLKKVFK